MKLVKKFGIITWQIVFWTYVSIFAIGLPVAILKYIFG